MTDNFGDKWWDSFLSKSEKMSKTQVFKNCIAKEETVLFRKYVMQIIKDLARLRTTDYGYRIYVEGKQLAKSEMTDIYNNPPSDNETIEEWSKLMFGNKKFGMIINSGEKFNVKLSKNIALKTKPLLDKTGFPREGINFTIFIGNYDKTPLGIHQDPIGENVLHFHLGPGDKTMYTWDQKKYEALAGEMKYNNMDIEKFLPYATQYSFKEGDLYFMPHGEYHVGTQNDLSIAVTFWFYNHSKSRILNKLSEAIREQYFVSNSEPLYPDLNNLENTDGIEDTLKLIGFPEEYDSLSYKDILREGYKDIRYSLASNCGYKTSPFPIDYDIEKIEHEQEIIIEEPFKILYRENIDESKLLIYVRGVKFEFNNNVCITEFIDLINIGKPLKVITLLDVLDSSWEDDIGYYMIDLFYKHHAIKFK
ncbi:hypothetical protein [Chryseobacterium sp. SIMBA_029]|uniref:hypothetical protein n=2 Tax=Bacteria TaxID=2 RepID=UPI00397974D7